MDKSITNSIDDFFGRYAVRKFDKGQVLIVSGDVSNTIYQLVSGRVKQYDITYRGDEIILNVFKPPAFFPMSMAMNKTENPYTFQAETDIEIRQVPSEDAVKFLKDNPDVLYDLLSRVYIGLDGLLGRIAQLMSSSARGRLIYELLIACQRFGVLADDGTYSLDMNETDLAARAGLTRETVSREMQKLETEGLVSVKSRKVTILDFTSLESRLGKAV